MGEFPSGQRGQTVNLLSVTSVVRIHLPPPKIPNIRLDGRNFLILGEGGFERRLLATVQWTVATAVAFSAEKANPPSCWILLLSVGNRLDPHRDPHGEMSKERRRGYAWYPLRRSVFFAACSHHLCHEITHLFGGALLHLPRDVGVGSQRETCVEVTEHTRYRFYVHAILERQGCECVT